MYLYVSLKVEHISFCICGSAEQKVCKAVNNSVLSVICVSSHCNIKRRRVNVMRNNE